MPKGHVYRKAWWTRHDRANHAFITDLQGLLRQYGKPVSRTLASLYRQEWPPGGLTVQVTAYANWAGAYSTAGGLIVMASLDDETSGSAAFETVFHEGMHQWDDAMEDRIRQAAAQLHLEPPRDLSHALIFYTAGYVVSRIVPAHRPYGDAVWARGALPPRAQFDAHWLPYLRGETPLEAALEQLILGLK